MEFARGKQQWVFDANSLFAQGGNFSGSVSVSTAKKVSAELKRHLALPPEQAKSKEKLKLKADLEVLMVKQQRMEHLIDLH